MDKKFRITSSEYLGFEREHRRLLGSGDHTAAEQVIMAFKQELEADRRRQEKHVHPHVPGHFGRYVTRQGLHQFALA